MKKISAKVVAVGFGSALLLLMGVGTASYLSIKRASDNKQRVEHTREVLENISKISDGLKDAQSGRRGYIITREDIFIRTYRRGYQTTQEALNAVRRLTIDNPRQQRRIDELEPLIARRLALLQQSIESLQQNKYNRQTQIDITNQGEQFQEEVQAKLATMDKEERTLLQQRSAATDASINNTILVVVLGYSLSFGLLFGVYLLLKKEIGDRIKAETALKRSQNQLERANEDLEMRVHERTAALLEINQALQAEIAERQQAESALKQIAVELGDLYNNAPCGYHSLDKDGTFILINDTELNMLGYTREEILGKKKFSELITAESLSTFKTNYPRFKERGWVRDLEFQMIRKDGTILPVSLNAIAIKDAEGNFIMSRSTTIDISDRKQAESALYKSNSILNSVLESTPDIIFVKDLQNRYVVANSTAANFVGTTVEEMIGKDDNQLFPPEIAEAFIEADRAIVRTGKALVYEDTLPKPGNVETLLTVKCPWRDGEGNIIGTIGISRNISDRKQAEAALKQARDRLEIRVQERTKELTEANATLQVEIAERKEAERKLEQLMLDLQRSNQELEQFAYLASHDLQEPLRAVTGYTELLEQEYKQDLDETAKEYMGYIIDGATRMRQLIQDLLSYSRVGTRGKAFVPTDCNQAVRQALNDLQVAIAEHNAIISYDRLPKAIADKAQLAQLFQNLIGNAIKFRRDEPPQIQIWAEAKDDLWLFGVRDNGIGIKPRYLERIFELFKRLHTRKEFPGTGIGLAICKKIVERHGGNIWAESQPGVGTTFYFTLPLRQLTVNS